MLRGYLSLVIAVRWLHPRHSVLLARPHSCTARCPTRDIRMLPKLSRLLTGAGAWTPDATKARQKRINRQTGVIFSPAMRIILPCSTTVCCRCAPGMGLTPCVVAPAQLAPCADNSTSRLPIAQRFVPCLCPRWIRRRLIPPCRTSCRSVSAATHTCKTAKPKH